MKKVKLIIKSLLVILISLFFINESNSILYVGNNIKIHLNHNQKSELEIPHQHNFNKYDDDEKCMNSNSFQLSLSPKKHFLFPDCFDIRTEDYTGLVWQPPKSV